MVNFLKKLFSGNNTSKHQPVPEPNYGQLIESIRKKEHSADIQPGKEIHTLEYDLFEIRLDRDITEHYRITVFHGNERIYSFTVFVKKEEPGKLEDAFRQVISFLKTDRNISGLPENELIKGFYFGNE